MTSLAPSSYLLHILLALFDNQDVPKIIFRYPYTQHTGQNSTLASPQGPDEVSENFLLDSLLMYSQLNSDTCKLLLSVDRLLLQGHVEMFSQNKCSFVFILRTDTPVCVLDRFYEISRLIAQVYQLEEERCQFFTNECVHKYYAILGSATEISNEAIYQSFHSSCGLGREMQSIFNGLKSGSCSVHRINNLVPLHLSLDSGDCSEIEVKAYHSLLLIDPPKCVSDSLSCPVPQLAHKFLQVVNPVRSLEEMAIDADIHLDEVIILVKYLLSRGRARLIFPISGSNVYVLHPSCNIQSLTPAAEFQRRFTELDMKFSQLISKFSDARKIEDLLSFTDSLLYRLIAWLLEHRFIVQLHKYIFLMPPNIRSDVFSSALTLKEDARLSQSNGYSPRLMFSNSESSFTSPTNTEIALDSALHRRSSSSATESSEDSGDLQTAAYIDAVFGKRSLTWEEREEVEQAFRSSSEPCLHLLRRLAPYFDGTHHVEEILFNELLSGVNEKDLEKLLLEFSNILVPYVRPEFL